MDVPEAFDIYSYEDYKESLDFLITVEKPARREQLIKELEDAFPAYAATQKAKAEENRKRNMYKRFHFMSVEQQVAELAEIKTNDTVDHVVVWISSNNGGKSGYAPYDREAKEIIWDDLVPDLEHAERNTKLRNTVRHLLFRREDDTSKPVELPMVPRKLDFAINGKKTGDVFEDAFKKYRVTHESYYISSAESADLEDGWDNFVDPGWHTEAVLIEDDSHV